MRIAVLALAACCLAPTALSETFEVGKNGITTIQDAVNAAVANADEADVINVPPGTYAETVTIDLTGTHQITIQKKGNKKATCLVAGQGTSNPAIRIEDFSNVTLKGLTLQSGDSTDGVAALEILGTSTNIVVDGCGGVGGDDVGVELGPDTMGVGLVQCTFDDLLQVGFKIDGRHHTIENCRADGFGMNGFLYAATSANCRMVNSSAASNGGFSAFDTGVIDVAGSGHVFTKCKADGGMDGFAIDGEGHRFDGCSASDNLQAGFLLGSQAVLDGCSASGNIIGFMGGGPGCTITGGNYSSNGSHGALVSEDGTQIEGGKFDKNGGDGIAVINSNGVTIRDCSFKGNGNQAVTVTGSSDCWLEGNSAKGGGFIDAGTDNGGRDNKVKGGDTNDF